MIIIGIMLLVMALILLFVSGSKWTTISFSIIMSILAIVFIKGGYDSKKEQQYQSTASNQVEQNTNENYDSNSNNNNNLNNNTSNNQTSQQSQNTETSQPSNNQNNNQTSQNIKSNSALKNKYLAELDALSKEDEAIHATAGTTKEMKIAASKSYELWDAELNKIYGVLKQNLSKNEMEALKQKQRQWINYRDSQAEEAFNSVGRGTMGPLLEMETKASLTKDRCYELVDLYMK